MNAFTSSTIPRRARLFSGARLAAACALAGSALLAACGGGGSGHPAVTGVTASPVQYSRTMTVTVSGRDLAQDQGIRMETVGGCGEVFPIDTRSDDTRQFTCSIESLGPMQVRILDVATGEELASLFDEVEIPQVEVSATQGTWSGKFVVELDPVAAPISTKNFLNYVNAGFYRNTLFHRVVAGFVVQAGGYTAATGTGTEPVVKTATRDPITLESNNGLKNLRGTIAMARTSEPNSATSQWYVNLVDNGDLDYVDETKPGYAVFGKVISGLDAIDTIAAAPVRTSASTGLTHLPVTNVVISAATQIR